MTTSIEHSPQRTAVFFLEDNAEVLDASAAFFESYGIPVLRATTPTEGWRELEHSNGVVRCAYVDKTLQRQQNAGFDFVERARVQYPDVDFTVVSGWPLTDDERKRVAAHQISFMEKARSSPADLLARFDKNLSTTTATTNAEGESSESAAAPADVLFRSRLAQETLSQREARFQIRLGKIARDLVRRLEHDSRFGEGSIYVGASSYSTDELIQEICDGSELGLTLLDAHFAELEEMAQEVYKQK